MGCLLRNILSLNDEQRVVVMCHLCTNVKAEENETVTCLTRRAHRTVRATHCIERRLSVRNKHSENSLNSHDSRMTTSRPTGRHWCATVY